jgi:putative N6-adenine-specific DNA methylase
MSQTRYKIFVVVTPGLEPLLIAELQELGIGTSLKANNGGVSLTVARDELWSLALRSRIAESVRIRLGRSFKAHNFDELVLGLGKLPWSAYLPRAAQPRVKASCHHSALYHSGAVVERAQAYFESRPEPGSEAIETTAAVAIRITRDYAQVSIDATGELLHKRGYRTHVGAAPIRETLAAALLRAAGYEGKRPLWDPFCGSGTIPIEAAAIAAGQAPGSKRTFAFQEWPTHDADAYGQFVAALPSPSPVAVSIIACDIEEREIKGAAENLARAALTDGVKLITGDFAKQAEWIPKGAVVVTNAPYGQRTSTVPLAETFGRFGALLNERADLTEVYVLAGHDGFERQTRLKWKPVLEFKNRGLPVRFLKRSSQD